MGYSAWGHRELGRAELVTLTLSREQLGRTRPSSCPSHSLISFRRLLGKPTGSSQRQSLGAAVPWNHVLRAIRQAREEHEKGLGQVGNDSGVIRKISR